MGSISRRNELGDSSKCLHPLWYLDLVFTLCHRCVYQGCRMCRQEESDCLKYLNVCPRCVFKEKVLSLIPYIPATETLDLIPTSEIITKSRTIMGTNSDDQMHVVSACSGSTSSGDIPKLAWYCHEHRPTQEKKYIFEYSQIHHDSRLASF